MFREKIVEKLKENFAKLNVPSTAKWADVSKELAEDAVFKTADNLEQLT